MSPDPSSYGFFFPFLVKITILILYPLVMAKGPVFYWTQVCCCYMEERGQNSVVLYTSCFMHFSYTLYTSELESSSQRSWKSNNEKKWQVCGYLDLLLLAIPLLCKESQLHLQEYTHLWI